MAMHPLQRLVSLDGEFDAIVKSASSLMREQIDAHGWPDEGTGIVLLRAQLGHALTTYLRGSLSGSQLETCAELLECNDFLEFEPGCEGEIAQVLFELATPWINPPLTPERALHLLAYLCPQ